MVELSKSPKPKAAKRMTLRAVRGVAGPNAAKRLVARPKLGSRAASQRMTMTLHPVTPASPSQPSIAEKPVIVEKPIIVEKLMARPRAAAGRSIRAELATSRAPAARLIASTPCDTAFRIIALPLLEAMTALREPACRGEADALHKMRRALTNLRAAILFFSKMVNDADEPGISRELKWLNRELGSVRDLDVAVERVAAANPKRRHLNVQFAALYETCAEAHRLLAQSLRSKRFQRLMARTTEWIVSGPWRTMPGMRPAKRRAATIAAYGARELPQRTKELLRKCRKLPEMDERARHRVRIATKRIICSIRSCEGLAADKAVSSHRRALRPLHKAQRCLGQLNDDVRGQAIARSLHKKGVDIPLPRLRRRDKKRLLQRARKAYRQVAALKTANKTAKKLAMRPAKKTPK